MNDDRTVRDICQFQAWGNQWLIGCTILRNIEHRQITMMT
jgi:hypothetical protein